MVPLHHSVIPLATCLSIISNSRPYQPFEHEDEADHELVHLRSLVHAGLVLRTSLGRKFQSAHFDFCVVLHVNVVAVSVKEAEPWQRDIPW